MTSGTVYLRPFEFIAGAEHLLKSFPRFKVPKVTRDQLLLKFSREVESNILEETKFKVHRTVGKSLKT